MDFDQLPTAYHSSGLPCSSSAKDLQRSSSKACVQNVFVVYGPAGSGKTSIAKYIAGKFNFKYIEGDEVRDQTLKISLKAQLTLS
jgi:replication-associated recombination protein RarA